jgi:hypothetical protein
MHAGGAMVVCAGCELPVIDRFMFKVMGRAWHSQCLQCVDCRLPLTGRCFCKDDRLFCRDDFFRLTKIIISIAIIIIIRNYY